MPAKRGTMLRSDATVPLSAHTPTLLGLSGSLMILCGSLAVGWIAPGSALLDVLPMRALRSSPAAVELSAMLVVFGGLALLAAWLMLGRALNGRPDGLRLVLIASAAWILPLLPALPLYSRDSFSYLAQGRLMVAGLDPYVYGVAALPGWFSGGVDPLWAHSPAPYGPLFIAIETAIVRILGSAAPELQILAFRLIAVAGAAAVAYFGYRIAVRRGVDAVRTLWVLAASPLVIANLVVAAHNDALMLGLILAGIYAAMQRRPVLGLVLVTAAVGIKPIALVALPIIGIIWAGVGSPLRRRLLAWAVSGAVCMGLLGILGFVQGIGYGWISSLSSPVSIFTWFAPVGLLAGLAGAATGALGGPQAVVEDVIKSAGLLTGLAAAGWLLLTRVRLSGEVQLALVFAAVVASSPVIYPWYGLWVIASLAAVGIADGLALHLVVFATVFLTCVNLNEPLDVLPALAGGWPRVAVVVAATLGCVVIAAAAARHAGGAPALRPTRRVFAPARVPQP